MAIKKENKRTAYDFLYQNETRDYSGTVMTGGENASKDDYTVSLQIKDTLTDSIIGSFYAVKKSTGSAVNINITGISMDALFAEAKEIIDYLDAEEEETPAAE